MSTARRPTDKQIAKLLARLSSTRTPSAPYSFANLGFESRYGTAADYGTLYAVQCNRLAEIEDNMQCARFGQGDGTVPAEDLTTATQAAQKAGA